MCYCKAHWANDLRVAGIFGDHMVLQQGINAPIWGVAKPNSRLEIQIGDWKIPVLVQADGKWMGKLPQLQAGGPYTLQIAGETDTLRFQDVLVGEVWIASGQSNMWWPVAQADAADSVIKYSNWNQIRMATIPTQTSAVPVADIDPVAWLPCSSQTVGSFSAVAYHYAFFLHQQLRVPVGIIHASWGATPIESWMSGDILLTLPEYQDRMVALTASKDNWQQMIDSCNQLDAIRPRIVASARNGVEAGVHKATYSDAHWDSVMYPITATKLQASGYWGFVWLRKQVKVEQTLSGNWILDIPYLSGEPITVYWDGVQVAQVKSSNGPIKLKLPFKTIKKGNHVISIRLYHNWGEHKFGDVNSISYITNGRDKIALDGVWKFNKTIEPDVPQWQGGWTNTPSVIYNKMIAPIAPYGIKGFIWYQGETNTVSEPLRYRYLFPAFIQDWRNRFQLGNIPFYYVQLTNYMQRDSVPSASHWAIIREAQKQALKYPNTGMAVTIDLGEANNIHPSNKRDVGKRLGLLALGKTYFDSSIPLKENQYIGPEVKSIKFEDGLVKVLFRESTGPLEFRKDTYYRNFALAGADQKFYWADQVEIKGMEVWIQCNQVLEPIAIRYAWGDNPSANLQNASKLPASPFRSDDW
jgi:sialate O-acetylesterase